MYTEVYSNRLPYKRIIIIMGIPVSLVQAGGVEADTTGRR